MTNATGPLYELTFSVERDIVGDFDRWLDGLSRKSLLEQGIVEARIFEVASDATGSVTRICQFQCADDGAIDELLDGFFADADATAAQQFGEAVNISSRTLREDHVHDLPPVESPDCLNCGTRLRGQYCGQCGQRARSRLISLWQLVSEAFGDLLELDSRLWRTLIPLLARPGRLTRDYLEGRRARYMPPFRTYLVLSLVFFVVAFFDPRDDLSLLFEPEPEPTPEEIAERAAHAEAAKQEIIDELAAEGIIVGSTDPDGRAAEIDEQTDKAIEERDGGFNIQIDDDTGNCNIDGGDLTNLPAWLKRRFTPERLERVCERVTADRGKTFAGLLLDNIPVALIVLLPLMALVLKILYPLSRRYFVEHLLFFVHYHAFFFLILTVQILFARVSGILRIPEAVAMLAIVAASLYIPVYLYMAMRRVYGQGRILTFLKYVALVFSYTIGATLTMLGAVLFALVSV
jgi:hypothetical protein